MIQDHFDVRLPNELNLDKVIQTTYEGRRWEVESGTRAKPEMKVVTGKVTLAYLEGGELVLRWDQDKQFVSVYQFRNIKLYKEDEDERGELADGSVAADGRVGG